MKMKQKFFWMISAIALAAIVNLLSFQIVLAQPAGGTPKISAAKITLNAGKTKKLSVKNTSAKVKWSTSNKKVATVSSKGKVTAKKAGTAVITASVSGRKLKCKVTVKAFLNKKTAEIQVGKTLKLKVTGASSKVKWSSSNKSCAAVTQKGVVQGKKQGAATITAKFGKVKLTCKMKVLSSPESPETPKTPETPEKKDKYVSFGEQHRTYKVLVINFDPVFPMAEGKRWHELVWWWNDPHELAKGYAKEMAEASYGYINYQVVDWIDIEEMPQNKEGKSYTIKEYYETLIKAQEYSGSYWEYPGWKDFGLTFDYDKYLSRYNVYSRVNKGEVDEVWMFTGPLHAATLYETQMVGRNAFWCNSPGMEKDCRLFVVYGFNYERAVAEMMHDAGHRAESIMHSVYGWANYDKDYKDYTDWEKFTVYDAISPGNAGVGLIHFAPNSKTDYDWGNQEYVYSNYKDWLNYPNLTGAKEKVNCSTWGNGDQKEFIKWWFMMMPHVNVYNEGTDKYLNWWVYFTLDYINNPPR